MSGFLIARVTLSAQGSIRVIKTGFSGHALFVRPVESLLREAHFKPDYAGKTVTLVCHFELLPSDAGQAKEQMSFGASNHFWIKIEPPGIRP